MPVFVILKNLLLLVCRNPDTIIFQDEIEPIVDLMVRNDEIFDLDPVTDRVSGNMNKDVRKRGSAYVSSLSVQNLAETDPEAGAGFADSSTCWTPSHTGGEIPRFLYDCVRESLAFQTDCKGQITRRKKNPACRIAPMLTRIFNDQSHLVYRAMQVIMRDA